MRHISCSAVGVGYSSFTDVPAWQAARAYKLAIYALCSSGALAQHAEPRGQLRGAASRPPALIAEAYGRFNPLDSARLLTQAKAELIESQNHLIDACDQKFITEAERAAHHKLAQEVIDQLDGWRQYLQSSEAQQNVKTIREQQRRQRPKERNRNQVGNRNRNENAESESE